MKQFFTTALIVLIVMSFVAAAWVPEQPDDRIVLTWVTGDSPVFRKHIEMFNAQSEKYRVVLDPNNAGLEKVIVQSLAGVGGDLFDVHSSSALTALVRAGVARDVTEDLRARGIHPDDYWDCLRPLFVHDDRMYGLPPNSHAPAIWFNKDHFDEMGEPYPESGWTWEEFIGVAQRMTIRNEGGEVERWGFLGPFDPMLSRPLLRQWGTAIFNDVGTRCMLDDPRAGAALQFGQDLIYKHKVMPSPVNETSMATQGGWGSGAMTWFGQGKGSMAIGGRWWLVRLRQPDFAGIRLGAVELPRGPVDRNIGSGRATIASAASENYEGILDFLEFMHSEQYNRFINAEADGICPVKQYAYTEDYLFNPDYPEEDFNLVWRNAIEKAEPMSTSPYINGALVDRTVDAQVDMMKLDLKSGHDAMETAAEKINDMILRTLEIDEGLRERYREAVAKGAEPAAEGPEIRELLAGK